MKKILLAFLILVLSSLIESCGIQQEVDIFKEREQKTERFTHRKHTVRDGVFSKDRKLKVRHRYFYRDNNGKIHFRPTPYRPDFIHYKRTGRVWNEKGNARVIKRGTVAVTKKQKRKK